MFNYIGKSNWSEDAGFNGNIFDARVYSDARTAAEIKNDFNRQLDLKDSNLLLQYDFDGNLTNAAAGTTGGTFTAGASRNGTSSTSGVAFGGPVGTTLTVTKDAVEDAGQTKAAADQQFQLLRKTPTSGTAADDTLTGSAGNDFIAGHGGNDTLTGAGGADIFAWLAGDRGTDMVNDFKVALGDMIDLSGILSASGLSALSTDADLRKFLQLTKSNNDEILRIDSTGQGNFVTPTKTINFVNGALNGLDDSLTNLVKSKVINVDKQTSTPLVLDLNGDGVHTTTLTKGVAFDNQGTGQLLKTGWTDGKDGLLVLDLNHDGLINSGRELFGSNTLLANGSTAKDGFEALRQYDANHDNLIDAKDAIFNSLQLWVDGNQDGVTQNGELHALTEFGVQAIHLTAQSGTTLDNANLLGLVSQWTGTDGKTHDLADVWFTTTNLSAPERMVAQAQKVDLSALGTHSYEVHQSDVLTTANSTVLINAVANDVVKVDQTGWHDTGLSASLNQHVYSLWENNKAYLLVDQQAHVQAVL